MGILDQLTSLFRSSDSREQVRQAALTSQGRAVTPDDEINQREVRRLAMMSDEDQAWEQAALQRHRAAQAGLPS